MNKQPPVEFVPTREFVLKTKEATAYAVTSFIDI